MKRTFKYLCALISIMLPFVTYANGVYAPGTVTVNVGTSQITMTGAYNVRYNPNVSTGGVSVTTSTSGSITFDFQPSNNGPNNFCSVPPGHQFYSAAQEALKLMGNGAFIYATRPNSISDYNCSYFSVTSASSRLD